MRSPLTDESIASRIYFIRGEKVLLDSDLASLYGIETKELKRAVRRNLERFPEDFMFLVKKNELENLRYQIGSSRYTWGGNRYPLMAFTEQGVAMLSSVLHGPTAIKVNIAIMRTFVALRKLMQTNKELAEKIRQLESKYDSQFKAVFDAIRQLILQESKKMRQLGLGCGRNESNYVGKGSSWE